MAAAATAVESAVDDDVEPDDAPPIDDIPAPRCTYATDECRAEYPPFLEHRPDHFIACWHADRLLGESA